jgi:hypothetical protein
LVDFFDEEDEVMFFAELDEIFHDFGVKECTSEITRVDDGKCFELVAVGFGLLHGTGNLGGAG